MPFVRAVTVVRPCGQSRDRLPGADTRSAIAVLVNVKGVAAGLEAAQVGNDRQALRSVSQHDRADRLMDALGRDQVNRNLQLAP